MIGILLGAGRFQALLLRASPATLTPLVTVPLFTVALLSIMTHAGRADLAPYAVVGSSVMAVWNMALTVSGDIIDHDRSHGTLEATLATPAPLSVVVLGRTTTVTAVSLLSLVESVLVARIGFGVALHVPHVALLLATLLVTALAMVGTATAMAGTFVLARSARTFQNALSYPFYLLSGAVVPTALLPGWLQPVTRAVFLSWATELVRDCLKAAPVADPAPRLLAVLGLGAAGYGAGMWMLAAILRRVRGTGSVSHA